MSKLLTRPEREPDFVSKSGCEYWFEEMIKTNSSGALRTMKIVGDALYLVERNSTLITEVQRAWRKHLEKIADKILLA